MDQNSFQGIAIIASMGGSLILTLWMYSKPSIQRKHKKSKADLQTDAITGATLGFFILPALIAFGFIIKALIMIEL